MVYALGAVEENYLLASRLYAAKYPDPQVKCFEILMNLFERTGHIEYEKRDKTKKILTNENQLAISIALVENREFSVREISRVL